MTSRDRIVLVCAALASAGPGLAQDAAGTATLSRAIEMPAHRALMASRAGPGVRLAPFESDGCSGGLSEAWHLVADQLPEFTDPDVAAPVFEPCCTVHDRAYHDAGGVVEAEASFAARLAADQGLRACVIAVGESAKAQIAARHDMPPAQVTRAFAVIAGAMFLAVRFGGGPCSGLPWRWGYGYPDCSVLTPQGGD